MVSLVVRENYPFSHFPMYANPSPERFYFSITDGEGKDLPIATLTGITCPKVGKIFQKKARERHRKDFIKPADIAPEETQSIAAEIFEYLRKEAQTQGKDLPSKLQLRHTKITFKEGHVQETPVILAQE